MGTRRTDYVIIGARLPVDAYGKLSYDLTEELEFQYNGAKPGDKGILYDGMCCEYFLAGILVYKGEEHEGIPLMELDGVSDSVAFEIQDWLWATLGIDPAPISVYALSHWH